MQVIRNGGLPENWLALFISIAADKSSTKSLSLMGINFVGDNRGFTKEFQEKFQETIRKTMTKENLQKLYIDQDLSNAEISRNLGVSHTTVSKFLKKYEIYKLKK